EAVAARGAAEPAAVAEAPAPSAIDALVDALPIASAAAGERPAPPVQPATQPARQTPAATPAPVPEIAEGVDPRYAHERRFNMMQNGRVMTADDFDAWLEERQIDLRGLQAVAKASATPEPAGPQPATAAAAANVPSAGHQQQPQAAGGVTLQVAAFGARDNAERALAMLQGAGISGARLVDGFSAGRSVWRVQVGPVAAGMVQELSARFAGL